MIAVAGSGNNNIRHIVTYDLGERPVPPFVYTTPSDAIPNENVKKNPGQIPGKFQGNSKENCGEAPECTGSP
jgi:hypothetical protein